MSTRFNLLNTAYHRMLGRYDESRRRGDHKKAVRQVLAAARLLQWTIKEARVVR